MKLYIHGKFARRMKAGAQTPVFVNFHVVETGCRNVLDAFISVDIAQKKPSKISEKCFHVAESIAKQEKTAMTEDCKSCVYFSETKNMLGLIKIGYTTRIEERLSSLGATRLLGVVKTDNPDMEYAVHAVFDRFRVGNTEYFNIQYRELRGLLRLIHMAADAFVDFEITDHEAKVRQMKVERVSKRVRSNVRRTKFGIAQQELIEDLRARVSRQEYPDGRELAKEWKISEATASRKLKALEDEGIIERAHDGASLRVVSVKFNQEGQGAMSH